MAKKKDKVFCKVAETAKESDTMRMRRIDGSQNGATLRTKVVRDKTKYNRNLKHKKSFAFCYGLKSLADAGISLFMGVLKNFLACHARFNRASPFHVVIYCQFV
ncbi:MAG: hypothetical protein SPL52_15105 [Fibrobacter sp.]|nr:hypothetical protein [Fibrobacter sp.]